MKRLLIALTLVAGSTATLADCPAPLPRERPSIPDGLAASADKMQAAGEDVRIYVRALEAYLDCRGSLHPLQHNYLVDLAEGVAEAYNTELARFFNRSDMLATK